MGGEGEIKKRYYRLFEVANILEVANSAVRYWNREYKVTELKRSNVLLFTSDNIERLKILRDESRLMKGKKECSRCTFIKPSDHFITKSKKREHKFCRKCRSQIRMLWVEQHKDKIIAYRREYYKQNKIKLKTASILRSRNHDVRIQTTVSLEGAH
jgi:hypothetical protein